MEATYWIQAISAGVAAIVTGILARITFLYMRDTKRIAKAGEMQIELNLRPFLIVYIFRDSAGLSPRLCYKNIGHSPALKVETEPFDAGKFFLDFDKYSLIDVGESRELHPRGRGKTALADGMIQAVPVPDFLPNDLEARGSDLDIVLKLSYENLEQVPYLTTMKINRRGIEIVKTEKAVL